MSFGNNSASNQGRQVYSLELSRLGADSHVIQIVGGQNSILFGTIHIWQVFFCLIWETVPHESNILFQTGKYVISIAMLTLLYSFS